MDLPFFSRTASAVPRFHTLQRDQLVRLGVQWSRAQLKQMGEMWDFYSGRKSGEERNTSMNISNCRIMGLMPCARVLSPIQEVEGRRMNGRIRLVDIQGWPWNASWQEFVGYLWIWPIFKREISHQQKWRTNDGDLRIKKWWFVSWPGEMPRIC